MAGISKRVSGAWVSGSERIMKTATDIIVPPTTIYTDGTNATVGLKGNMSQSGTPTPSAPIQPQECGERTGNLFDIENITHEFLNPEGAISYESAMNLSELIRVDGDYTVSWNAVRSGAYMRVSTYDDNKNFIARIVAEGTYTHSSYSNTHTGYIRINYENSYQLSDVQVNTGSTALPYEPYGYKIPILLNSQTINKYLGTEQTERQIKKLVLTGREEGWTKAAGITATDAYQNYNLTSNYLRTDYIVTHMPVNSSSTDASTHGYIGQRITLCMDKTLNLSDIDLFKAWLASEYSSGHPVTLYYVRTTPETAVVNEPLMKIGDYADTVSNVSIPVIAGGDTISVDTTVQPSEVTISYKGWHPVQNVHERENGQWD